MSANDKITIGKNSKGEFVVRHIDMDGCYNRIMGKFGTLKEAKDLANSQEDPAYGSPEYGIEILDNCL